MLGVAGRGVAMFCLQCCASQGDTARRHSAAGSPTHEPPAGCGKTFLYLQPALAAASCPTLQFHAGLALLRLQINLKSFWNTIKGRGSYLILMFLC